MNQTNSGKSDRLPHTVSPDFSTKRAEQVTCSKNPADDEQFQAHLLAGVSRTFALTIPQLPEKLRKVVSNAYLLCRTIDTIEDEPNLTTAQKKMFGDLFLEVLESDKDTQPLISQLAPLLSRYTIPAEHELIQQLDRVVEITRCFDPEQQKPLIRCVRIMTDGMIYFQHHTGPDGLRDQQELDKYCYHVAGVVGEMLTELFCHYSEDISRNHQELLSLSSSFGQGLQMTNILKDIWDDRKRGVCWLPKDYFEAQGLNLAHIDTLTTHKNYQQSLRHLVGIAHGHLENALRYTLLIPAEEKGIRKFCLWALGMAMMTLRKINANPGFTNGNQVKISRSNVKTTVAVTSLTVSSNYWVRRLFRMLAAGLPVVRLKDSVQA